MRSAKHLGAAEVLRLARPGRHAIGGQLYSEVSPRGERSWLIRYTRDGKPSWLSLGKADAGNMGASLESARGRAREALDAIARGENVQAARRFARRAAPAAATPVSRVTLASVLDNYIRQRQPGWTNPEYAKSTEQYLRGWLAPLASRPVDGITTQDIRACLEPHWRRTHATAMRTRIHIEGLFELARVEGLRSQPNPARLADLKPLLPIVKQDDDAHHAALDWRAVPALMTRLESMAGGDRAMEALALRWCILTATRTSEAIGARWSEIDRKAKLWTIPGKRMKRRKPHRVPLSKGALAVLDACPPDGELLFPGLHDGSMYRTLVGPLGYQQGQVTVHGFRSSFCDWAAENKICTVDVADAVLAHRRESKRKSRTTKAYLRTDYLEERASVAERWAFYLESNG